MRAAPESIFYMVIWFLCFTWMILSNDQFLPTVITHLFFFLITHLLKVDSLLCEFLLCLDNARRPGQCCSFIFFSYIWDSWQWSHWVVTLPLIWCHWKTGFSREIQKILANMPASLWLRESYKCQWCFKSSFPPLIETTMNYLLGMEQANIVSSKELLALPKYLSPGEGMIIMWQVVRYCLARQDDLRAFWTLINKN